MRSLMILALLSVVCVSSVYSLIRCTDNICDTVRCRMETEEACLGRDVAGRYRFDAKGGFCGCCSACIRVLRENENCALTMLIGGPKMVECGPGLHCDRDKVKCTKME